MEQPKARDVFFDSAAHKAFALGLRPNHLTLLQLPFYVAMAWAGLTERLFTLGLLQISVIILDGGDGILARRMGVASRRGAVLDAVFDLIGICLVLGLAARIWPAYAPLCLATLALNLLLYAQNALFHQKFVTYVRGPVVTAVWLETTYPGIMWAGVGIPFVAAVLLLAVRQALWRRFVGGEGLRWDALKPEFPSWSR